ncbi:PREDICTED: uncharacterized protein LOC108562533 [Nicrophorus vespilloides]|uniref:Uncharacterized protein LOC108562533 n=1 Tax=Nicrophorus vespilloides TaxID=110193 RepID=A0ABM1MP95_NICVS|nr:PREDICTED: uncharacterized protein LOC108562533 [Nicrophorus vespilloides]
MNKLVLVCFVVVAVAAMLQESEAYAVESKLQKEPNVETTVDGKIVKRSAQDTAKIAADIAKETARAVAQKAKETATQAATEAENVAKQAANSARDTARRTKKCIPDTFND